MGADPNFEIVAERADGVQGQSKMLELKPDLVLPDIEMPELNGLSLLAGIADRPYIICVTAHAPHTLHAFALDADDYLLKPYKDERLLEAIAYAASQIRGNGSSTGEERKPDPQPFSAIGRGLLSIRVDGRQLLLRMHEIDWVEAERDYVRISIQKTSYLIRETMQGIQARLDPQRFVRIHCSTIVNVHSIREIEPCATGECFVTLRSEFRAPSVNLDAYDRQAIQHRNDADVRGVQSGQIPDPIPSLRPIYEPSSLLRIGPLQRSASERSPRGFRRLCLSLIIEATPPVASSFGCTPVVPAVLRNSLHPLHAASTPVAIRSVITYLTDLSQADSRAWF